MVAAVAGALIALVWDAGPAEQLLIPMEEAVFSPWTRDRPGIDDFPVSFNEYLSSIAFLALVGGGLGFAFWYFYSRAPRSNNR